MSGKNGRRATNNSRACWENLIASRIEISLERVGKEPEYKELCRQQAISEKRLNEVLTRFSKEDQNVLHQYYDQSIEKENYELEETYIQGVKDGIQFLFGLGIFTVKEWL